MSDIIRLPYSQSAGFTHHYGFAAKYSTNMIGAYFLLCNKTNENSSSQSPVRIDITDVEYAPDDLYDSTDGVAGRCWIVTGQDIENQKTVKYYIRNWIDIVRHFEPNGYGKKSVARNESRTSMILWRNDEGVS